MNFVQQMMKQSTVVNSYYKAYYLSKAGIELGLSQLKHRGVGFEYTLLTGDMIFRDNFFSGFNYTLSTHLSGSASLLSKVFSQGSGCDHPYSLASGESLVVPLFRDNYLGSVAGTFMTGIHYQNLADLFKNDKIEIQNISSPDTATFGLLILSGEDLYDNGVFFRSGSMNTTSLTEFKIAFESYMLGVDSVLANSYGSDTFVNNGFRMYLMLSNTAQIEQSLCLHTISNSLETTYVLPTNSFFIQSQSSYGNQNVALDASYAQPIPSFLFTTYSNYSQ
ncbi:MAG: hypothetical protein NTY80_03530 [candidate division SR1 bacterium]|nr:hypothetical protein [candidate division SR1 bacterium]